MEAVFRQKNGKQSVCCFKVTIVTIFIRKIRDQKYGFITGRASTCAEVR